MGSGRARSPKARRPEAISLGPARPEPDFFSARPITIINAAGIFLSFFSKRLTNPRTSFIAPYFFGEKKKLLVHIAPPILKQKTNPHFSHRCKQLLLRLLHCLLGQQRLLPLQPQPLLLLVQRVVLQDLETKREALSIMPCLAKGMKWRFRWHLFFYQKTF